jgi:uncharacterized membrane protein YhaH (DUF805 family)
MNWQALFLSHHGRIGQKDYWVAVLILIVAWIVSHALHVLAPLIWLLLIYPWVCVIAKRLHDFGRSGWVILVPVAVDIAALCLAIVFGGASLVSAGYAAWSGGFDPSTWAVLLGAVGAMLVFLGIAGVVKIVFLLWVGLHAGDPGENRYGPPPGSEKVVAPTTSAG